MNPSRQLWGIPILLLASIGAGPPADAAVLGRIDLVGDDAISLDQSNIVSHLTASDRAVANVNGSTVHWSYLYDQSVLNVNGDAELSWLLLHDAAVANLHDGAISWVKLHHSSRVNLHSVDRLSWLLLNGDSEAHIYGTNFKFNGGHLSGKWSDGSDFVFWALDENEGPTSVMPAGIRLHNVPEPVALVLVGALAPSALMRRRS